MHSDAGITAGGGEQGADAADLEVAAAEVALAEGHVRHAELKISEGIDLPGLKGAGVEGGNGDGYVLDRFGPLLRGDHNFFDQACPVGEGHAGGDSRKRAACLKQETA